VKKIISIFKDYPRITSFVEIFPPLAVFFFYVWVLRPQANPIFTFLSYLFIVIFIIVPFVVHKESLSELGIRFDNFTKGIWKVGLVLYLCIEAVVILNEYYQFPVGFITKNDIISWLVWGIFQQFIIQSFFYLRFKRSLKNRYLSILGAAVVFSLIHALNVPLMVLTFFGGVVLCYFFSQNRNVFVVGISHAVISVLIQTYLCPWVIPDMLFGPREPFEYRDYVAYGSGVKVAVGDVNGDGKVEIVTSRGPHPANDTLIKVFDSQGKNLSSFFAFDKKMRFGANMAVGDVDGDKKKEIIAGTGLSPTNGAIIKVLDWKGKEISSFRAFSSRKDCGVNVASGDIDGDGKDEIVAGTAPGFSCLPELKIFTGKGKKIKRFFPFNKKIRREGRKRYGLNVACGNIMRDKKDELIVGFAHLRQNETNFKILDFKGRDIKYFLPYIGRKCGVTLNSGDINGDGYDEIITAPGPDESNPANLKVIGSRLDTLFDFTVYSGQVGPSESRFVYGLNVAAGDIDGDGKDELVTGPGPGPEYPSEVSILKPTGKHSFKVLLRFNAY
jgi:hypothetical protein